MSGISNSSQADCSGGNFPGIILLYHRIADVKMDPWGLCVSPENFGCHLEVIKKHTTPLSLSGLLQAATTNTIPKNACVLTFDDGYRDNLTQAKPLLENFEIPATVYVTTAYIGQDHEFWWDELEKVFLHTNPLPKRLELRNCGIDLQFDLGKATNYSEKELAADLANYPWQAPAGSRMQLYFKVWQCMRKLTHRERFVVIDKLLEWGNLDSTPRVSYRPMNSVELELISGNELISIGAHTMTHPSLPNCSEQEKWNEIIKCKHVLETMMGKIIDHFAYPHGEYDSETVDMVRKADFKSACITSHKICNQIRQNTDPFELPRITVGNFAPEKFERNIKNWSKT
jgi:peptidoglycan/xylan/chitin deacetylase (PgdA/CDA1 family)